MKRFLLFVGLSFLFVGAAQSQIAQWTFETSIPVTAGPHAAEVGTGNCLGFHTSGLVVYSNPTGNGSVESFSSNYWGVGDYYQFQTSSTLYSAIQIEFDHISSSTGPRDFVLQYSTDGVSFTQFGSGYVVLVNSGGDQWNTSSHNSSSHYSYDLSSVTALNNQANIYFRLVDNSTTSAGGGTVQTTGTSRVDNFTISGTVATTNYYSKSTGNLTDVATWGTNTDGSGTSPSNFTDPGQLFNVVNRASTTLNANWTVSGAGSKVIVGDGSSLVRLILPASITILSSSTNTVDVTNSAILEVQNNVYIPATSNIPYPHLGTLGAASTVEYSYNGTTATDTVRIPTASFGYLTLTDGLKYFSQGTTTVAGNIVADGVVGMNGWYQGAYSTVELAGDFTLSNGAVFDNDPAGNSARITLTITGTGTKTLSGGDFQLFRVQTLASPSTTLNLALSNANLLIGNTSGGSLKMQQTTHTLSLGTGNTFTLRGAGRFDNTHAGFISGTTTSNMVIDKTSAGLSIGNVWFTAGAEQLNNLSINCTSSSDSLLTLKTDLTLSGNLTMTSGFIQLDANDLSVTGTATGNANAYVRTNGSGVLKLLAVNGTNVSGPIGNSTYNPVTITNTDGLDWNLRVEDGLVVNEPPFNTNVSSAVQREWYVIPSSIPTTTNSDIVFQYNDGDPTQVGATFDPNANVQIWKKITNPTYTYVWIAVSGTVAPSGTPLGVRTATLSAFNAFTGYSFAISNLNAPLPVKLIAFNAQKINSGLANLTWELAACCSDAAKFEIQKSKDGRSFSSIATVAGSETNRFYSYNDNRLGGGITYYRLKIMDEDGKISYSKTVAIVNQADGLVLTSLSPNPATSSSRLTISAGKTAPVSLAIYNASGTVVKRWSTVVSEGNTTVDIDVANLAAGVYNVIAVSGDSKSVLKLVKQ